MEVDVWHVVSAEVGKEGGGAKGPPHGPPADPGDLGVRVLHVIVDVPDGDSEQVDGRAAAEQDGKGEEDPREVWRGEGKEAEKAHPHVLVPAPPEIHHHERQRVSEKMNAHEGRDGEHRSRAEEKHVHKVRGAATEGTLLEEAAVPDEEVHVEEELEAEEPEEEEVGEEAPDLTLVKDQLEVEIEGEGGDEVEGAGGGREEGRGEVEAGDDGDLVVPVERVWEREEGEDGGGGGEEGEGRRDTDGREV